MESGLPDDAPLLVGAAAYGRTAVITALAEAGADVLAKDKVSAAHEECVECASQRGATALHWAAAYDHMTAARTLLLLGVPIDGMREDVSARCFVPQHPCARKHATQGKTAIHLAFELGQSKLACFLAQSGARLDAGVKYVRAKPSTVGRMQSIGDPD